MSGSARSAGPLAGLRVMDVSIMAAGPWTGALLGMLGAEVIKVEPPAGDGTRWVMPTQRGMGTNYLSMNVNKKGVVIDLKTPEGRAQGMELLATCDVFVQNFRGGVIERLGFGYDAVRAANPRLVYCAISGFGETGPLSKAGCADPIMQAFSGFARANGAPGDPVEAFRFTGFLDLTTASVATMSILAALLDRNRSGLGQKVEVSMLEAALEIQGTRLAELLGAGLRPAPMGSASPSFAPDRAYATLDHELFVSVQRPSAWPAFCKAIGQDALADDPRFAHNAARVANRDALDALLEPVLRTRPAIWWLRVLQRAGVPCGLAHFFETFRHHVQVVANDMIADVDTGDWGVLSVAGPPWHFSDTPARVTRAPKPAEHMDAIFGRDAMALATAAAARSSGDAMAPQASAGVPDDAPLPLAGMQVVELAEGIAGPLAGLRLVELGATVTRVEWPGGDYLRGAQPQVPATGCSALFSDLNRGKALVRLSGVPDADRATVAGLLAASDVVVFDGNDPRLAGLGLDCLVAQVQPPLLPRLVRASVSAFGRQGPLAALPGSELVAQAMAGYTRYLGQHGGPARRLGADVASVGTGLFLAQGILAALLERSRSGFGQRVDVSLLNSLVSMKSIHLAAQTDPDVYAGPRVGGANYPPERGWATADEPIFFAFGGSVGAEGRAGWSDFVAELGCGWMCEDPRFDRNGRNSTGHGVDVNALRPLYEAVFQNHRASDLVALIRKHSGNAAVYQRADEAIAHPQVASLGLLREAGSAHDQAQVRTKVRSFPARFSRLQPAVPGWTIADAGTSGDLP
ncbi:MAG: CoA transferase [Rhodocyclaceae bacterium]|nr:CoA transferase [Rhodocyclaceae bacterium]MCA3099902.1 CoA transferase [Rhodocyclaceae bacterium]MCA3119941.1 CoA transferase [Rhodocyclaceae bacterium]MCA3124480.1 CoA transferase [Rhodocyclaceae bacterium]MCA3129413.1 CoA transferase [Rhodocyclaceae bacterium]